MSVNYLPADLPENWQTGQILSPTGTEVGLSEQHGHNYLMKAVNEAHRACNALLEYNKKFKVECDALKRECEVLKDDCAALKDECGALRKELDEKANGIWSIFSNFEQLGVIRGEETIHKIAEAMPMYSILFNNVNSVDSGHADIYPDKTGVLQIVKMAWARIMVSFRSIDGSRAWSGQLLLVQGRPMARLERNFHDLSLDIHSAKYIRQIPAYIDKGLPGVVYSRQALDFPGNANGP